MATATASMPVDGMRPPSPCHERVALPQDVGQVPPEQSTVVKLPRLGLRRGKPDMVRLARLLGGETNRNARLLLVDTSALTTPEDLSNMIMAPKGWLCTLDYRSCRHAC